MKNGQGSLMIRDEHGGSLAEFAIVMPLLFVILFGIIEFGILLYDKAMITNASREGARAGIVFRDPRPSDGEIRKVVSSYCAAHLISFGTGSTFNEDDDVIITRTGASAGDSLTVNVTYQFQFMVFSNLIALLGGDIEDWINLDAVTVMRLE
jgi:Flp pilus assembly protein TadG